MSEGKIVTLNGESHFIKSPCNLFIGLADYAMFKFF